MIWLNIIWLIFTVIFFVLGVFHWRMANNKLSHFQVPKNGWLPEDVLTYNTGKQNNYEFVDNLNRYVEDINQSTKRQNKFQALGYWVASLTALFSFFYVSIASSS